MATTNAKAKPFVIYTNTGGELTFNNRENLLKFALSASERLSVGMELFVKSDRESGLADVLIESYADMAYEVRQAIEALHTEEA